MLGINKISEDIENHLHFLKIFLSLIENAGELSGGELQRVALIKTLSREKPIILLDEPFSALDGDMIKKASILIQEHTKKTKSTTLIISHQEAGPYLKVKKRIELS